MADWDTYRQLQERERQRRIDSGGDAGGCGSQVLGCLVGFVVLSIIMCIIVALIWWRDDHRPNLFGGDSDGMVVSSSSGR
ncbi:hypothetical protein Dvina_32835 [Dactylosporangium vinaceum]|uniref:Uncharacterized protein n=1 Tax=Dactylosporangium vinaceum TaxID=53362 RepID=A0ABV5MA62_9ACTN|nr:hypothetical protein [Dactylosporangium vinaceum]UAB93069.1 hypothetical protein Dvina_32835 [Dactylosporangium vinaceum]